MAERHVHWWDGDLGDDESGGPSFVPPSPHRSPLASSTDDDDSLVDSPSPPTPVTTLSPIGEAFRTRDRVRGVLPTIQIPGNPHAYVRVRSPDDASLRLREPSSSPTAASPRKASATGLSRRGDTVSIPRLHALLDHAPSADGSALVWNVGDAPSSSTVCMISSRNFLSPVSVPPDMLYQPASNPPLKEMRIHCISQSLWGPLTLRASEIWSPRRRDGQPSPDRRTPTCQSNDYISLQHVIYAIYRYLHTPMTSQEYGALKDIPTADLQRSVARSFYKRCEAEEQVVLAQQRASPERRINTQSAISPSSDRSGANLGAGTADRGGLRRLDCLLGQTQFLGLSPVPEKPGEWYTRVTSPSP